MTFWRQLKIIRHLGELQKCLLYRLYAGENTLRIVSLLLLPMAIQGHYHPLCLHIDQQFCFPRLVVLLNKWKPIPTFSCKETRLLQGLLSEIERASLIFSPDQNQVSIDIISSAFFKAFLELRCCDCERISASIRLIASH